MAENQDKLDRNQLIAALAERDKYIAYVEDKLRNCCPFSDGYVPKDGGVILTYEYWRDLYGAKSEAEDG